MLIYWGFRAAAVLVRLLPLRVSYAVARTAGILAYYAWRGGRRRCIQNMTHVTGGDRRAARRHARASFGNYAVYLIDFVRLLGTRADEVTRRVQFDRWDEVQDLRTGDGLVIMTMHFGNWDIGAAMLARHVPVVAIADAFANPRLNRLVMQSREYLGMRVVPAGRTGPGLLRALRGNEVLAVLADVPAARGVEVEFFGATIAVSDGPARIALRTGASVCAVAMPRLDRWRDIVRAELTAIPFEATGEQEVDVQRLTQAVFVCLERSVRRDPAQWYIFRHLWVADMPTAG
ncbi:MAG: lysophospholipid acyltransferase family protein [Dehalococcoidia bacterium]